MNNLLKRIDQFLFQYNFKKPFGFLRIATAFFCLLYFICLASEMHSLIGFNGYIGREVSEMAINSKLIPRISWLTDPLIKAGLSDDTAVSIIMGVYLIALLFMLAGCITPVAVFIVWMIHLMIYNSTGIFSYGVDGFTNVLLFYCLIMPTGKYCSVDNFFRRRSTKKDQQLSNNKFAYESFCMRILQVHICIIYFFSGLNKLLMPGWLSGNSIWQTLMVPHFKIFDFSFLANHVYSTILLGWIVVAIELFYPLMMCFKYTRKGWLIGIMLMHFFISCFLSLPFFGLIMIIFNIAAFGWNEFYPTLSGAFIRCAQLVKPIFKKQ